MQCPACDNTLTTIKVDSIEVDVCKGGCGGIWFDRGEIEKFDEAAEFPDSEILRLASSPGVRLKKPGQRRCPHCQSEVLVSQFFDPHNQVQIDQCWSCAGIWLDAGELRAIRAQYKTIEERRAAVDQYIDRCLREHVAAFDAAIKEEIGDAEKRARARGLIAPFQTLIRHLFSR